MVQSSLYGVVFHTVVEFLLISIKITIPITQLTIVTLFKVT